ncbi:hypothetical protein [Metabacillus fastidiosus]|uniref:hypothetical protein n=1 Tax=Metabacillus fastidiosus TaxID=1458 RepID=UPI0008261814|nr:hypothetical protein [Metabacillus fastidiosus]MED4461827.1 hypothetical protein [Metabacillus fastidiosus]
MNSLLNSEDKETINVSIPYCYIWITEGYYDRPTLFREYVEGYVQAIGYKLIEIKGMNAICHK